jgi:hypothetical protein
MSNSRRIKQTSNFKNKLKTTIMKKNIFLAVAASCICICASAFDAKKVIKPIVTNKMEQSLANEFKNPSQVEWSESKHNTIQASLKVDGQTVQVFFGDDGEYICSITSINQENMPLKLRMAIAKKLPNIGISAILETSSAEGTSYYFQGMDAKGVKVWKGTPDGSIEFVKKL